MIGHAPPPAWVPYVSALVVALVLALRLRRMSRARRLRLETLWIVPAVYAALAAWLFHVMPPGRTGWIVAGAALLVGGVVGWLRGRMMRIAVDPETHRLSQRSSPAAMLFLVALVVVRMALRSLAARMGGDWHVDAAVAMDGLLALAVGVLAMSRLEMGLRARRLLREARGG